MGGLAKIKGVGEVLKKLKNEHHRIQREVPRALTRAGLFLQRASQKMVPVHQGNLKASAFTRTSGSGFAAATTVGYTAAYAVYAHENEEAAHGAEFNAKHQKEIANAKTPAQKAIWFNRGPGQQSKFLEKPMRDERRTLIKMIRVDLEK
jgi:hypothetical protein